MELDPSSLDADAWEALQAKAKNVYWVPSVIVDKWDKEKRAEEQTRRAGRPPAPASNRTDDVISCSEERRKQ
jgi:hypothetical protein